MRGLRRTRVVQIAGGEGGFGGHEEQPLLETDVIVKGDADDKVNLDHATATGATRVIDGETYLVYSLGTGTVLVDDDIQTTII